MTSPRLTRTCNAPSGKVTPGKIRAPRDTMLCAPTVTPSPSTAPSVIWVPSPMRQPAATMQSRSVQPGPISVPFMITARSTVEPAPTVTPWPSTTRLPTWAPAATEHRARAPPAGSHALDQHVRGERHEAAAEPLAHSRGTLPSMMSKVPFR